MVQAVDGITIGIGAQTGLGAINTFVRDAVNLVVTVAAGTDATGILLRNPEDLSKAFERIESDGGVVPGSTSRISGALTRVDGTISFTIDMKGNGVATTTPLAGEYDVPEYLERIFEGAQLQKGTPTASNTPYQFFTDGVTRYETLKIWRGSIGGATESWVFQDCTFNLTWNYVAGEKSTLTVEVFENAITYSASDTFPTNSVTVAFGEQRFAAPILESAAASLDSTTRSFTEGSIAIAYPEINVPDSNVTGGIINQIGTPRSVNASLTWILEEGEADFTNFLVDDLIGALTGPELTFNLGQAVGAGGLPEGFAFLIPTLRGETTDKVDAESGKVHRTIAGYAAIAGSSGFGSAAFQEFRLTAI